MNSTIKPTKEPIKILNKLTSFIKNHRKVSLMIAIIIALLLGGLTAFIVLSVRLPKTKETNLTTTTKKKVEPPKYYSPLTGLEVPSEADTKAPVIGVMIENSPEARPQSALAESGIVFEAICEAGITRFLVLFQNEKPTLIGPVRSVRPYYISWAAGFNAGIAHVGGSDDALAQIRNGQYRDLDQFSHAEAFWRSNERYAPHNVYTSYEKLSELNNSLGYTTSSFTAFPRVPVKKATTKPKTTTDSQSNPTTNEETTTDITNTAYNINVNISGPLFNSSYTYDAESKTYARSQAGAPHLDNSGIQIKPSVVVAMYVNEYHSGDYKNHEVIDTVGSGKATIFQDGLATEGTWNKSGQFEQLVFTDNEGKEILFNRGQVWIVAVPNNTNTVSYN